MTTFKDMGIGDTFKAGGVKMIKIRNNTEADRGKPLPKREPNAINLENGHHLMLGDKLPVILITKEVSE